jgi:hypothetical protein
MELHYVHINCDLVDNSQMSLLVVLEVAKAWMA